MGFAEGRARETQMVLRHSFVVAAGHRHGNRSIAVSSRDVRFVRIGAAIPFTVYLIFFRPCRRGAGCAVGPDRRWIAFLHYRGGGFVHSEAATYSFEFKRSDLYKRSLAGLVQEARSAQTGEGPPSARCQGGVRGVLEVHRSIKK